MNSISRRQFVKRTFAGSLFAFSGMSTMANHLLNDSVEFTSRVSLIHGEDRANMAFKSLQPFDSIIQQQSSKKRIVLKPNNVSTSSQLSSTHVETLEGVLEFLKSIGRLEHTVIAESAADGPAMNGYENFGYLRLMNKYGVKLIDLDEQAFEKVYVINEKDFRPRAMRTSSMLMKPENYVISIARMKTHDRVFATLSLKNVVFGAPIKDKGFGWGPNAKKGAHTDKPIGHGGGVYGINYNMFALADKLHPDFALIDGYQGMEGNGPTQGTPVEHRICVASNDWLAADRVALALMGIDFSNVGYLNFCYDAGMGEADLNKIKIEGANLNEHVIKYQLSDNHEKQLIWKDTLKNRV